MSTNVAHVPVMLSEVIQALDPRPGGRYIDCTLGNGGHARAILDASAPSGRLLGLDADPQAIEIARQALAGALHRAVLVNSNFVHVAEVAAQHAFLAVQGIVMDLGWSSAQMSDASRGFSFQLDGPLDMRYSPQQKLTAADLVNDLDERELADLIWRYGEDRLARRIARAIVAARPIRSTLHLAHVIEKAVGRREKIHPATRTFQALRIRTNDELGVLAQTLEQLPALLAPGGALAIISFHSLEDRLVKQFLAREAAGCICPPEAPVCTCGHRPSLTLRPRKPITPSMTEIAGNPRARSAKLRVAYRLSDTAVERASVTSNA
jgi:16S rRNA (cytosine1402-N4)-methyltransferase